MAFIDKAYRERVEFLRRTPDGHAKAKHLRFLVPEDLKRALFEEAKALNSYRSEEEMSAWNLKLFGIPVVFVQRYRDGVPDIELVMNINN